MPHSNHALDSAIREIEELSKMVSRLTEERNAFEALRHQAIRNSESLERQLQGVRNDLFQTSKTCEQFFLRLTEESCNRQKAVDDAVREVMGHVNVELSSLRDSHHLELTRARRHHLAELSRAEDRYFGNLYELDTRLKELKAENEQLKAYKKKAEEETEQGGAGRSSSPTSTVTVCGYQMPKDESKV